MPYFGCGPRPANLKCSTALVKIILLLPPITHYLHYARHACQVWERMLSTSLILSLLHPSLSLLIHFHTSTTHISLVLLVASSAPLSLYNFSPLFTPFSPNFNFSKLNPPFSSYLCLYHPPISPYFYLSLLQPAFPPTGPLDRPETKNC